MTRRFTRVGSRTRTSSKGGLSRKGSTTSCVWSSPSRDRTVRLMFDEQKADTAYGKAVLDGVRQFGCSYKGMFSTLHFHHRPARCATRPRGNVPDVPPA